MGNRYLIKPQRNINKEKGGVPEPASPRGLVLVSFSLGGIGNSFRQWVKAKQQSVALIGAARSECCVGLVQAIQDSQHPETLVKPEVMEIVEFWRWQQWEVIPTVGNGGY